MINILIFNCADSELSITIVWPNDLPEKAIPNTRTTKTKLPLPYSFLIIKSPIWCGKVHTAIHRLKNSSIKQVNKGGEWGIRGTEHFHLTNLSFYL